MPRYTAPAGEVIDGTKINERCVQKGHGDSVEGVEERAQSSLSARDPNGSNHKIQGAVHVGGPSCLGSLGMFL